MIQVLVVEDDPLVSATIQAELEDYCSAEVICRRTGASAMEVLKTRRLNAALIDALLPDMSGLELAERAANLNIPIMMTSGHPDAIVLCRRYSVPCIEKPFSPATLAERTISLIRQAEENIALVVASCAKLRERADSLRIVITESRRLIEESERNRDRRLRPGPLGR